MGRDKKEMKRINPETNKPFKCGNIREDGFMFDAYVKSVTRKRRHTVNLGNPGQEYVDNGHRNR